MTVKRYSLGDFRLHSGDCLPDAFLSYETHGELNRDRSNVIVYPTWYAGNHEDIRPAIGPGRALDPERYFIVVPDMFGNGRSSSPSNTPAPYDRARFPVISTYDNVRAQHQLMTVGLGIEYIQLVVGFSMGAQQAFHWGALYSDMLGAIAPICGTAKTSPHNQLLLESLQRTLLVTMQDLRVPPEKGLRAFTTIFASWGFSPEFYRQRKHLNWMGWDCRSIDDFLDNWHGLFIPKNDANDLLCMLQTWQNSDLGQHAKFKGDLAAALRAITCRAIVMPGSTDMYFPPEDNQKEVPHMPQAELRTIDSIFGHAAGGPGFSNQADDDFVDAALRELLTDHRFSEAD